MNQNVWLWPLMLLGIFLVGCTSDVLKPSKYADWVKDKKNGLRIERSGDLFEYELLFKPAPFMALVGMSSLKNKTQSALDSLTSLYQDAEYYDLKVSAHGQTDVVKANSSTPADFYDKLNYLTFEFQRDIILIAGHDTLPCTMYHCERNYGTAPYVHISLGFPLKDRQYSLPRKMLLFPQIEQVDNLPLAFEIDGRQIQKIPKLKI